MSHLLTPDKISRWLKDSKSQVGYYYKKVDYLIQLNQYWKAQKDIPLVLHSVIANFDQDHLTIAVDSSEWASHLHYTKFALLARLKNCTELATVTHIKWYVRSVRPVPGEKTTLSKTLKLSEENKQLIHSIAETIPHAALQSALHQLIKF